MKSQVKIIPILAPIAAALSVLGIAPYLLMDSVNPIKLFTVSLLATGYLLITILNIKVFASIRDNLIIWLVLSFALLSVVIIFTTQNNLSQQLYGVVGRQSGLIFHLALCGLLLAGNLYASDQLLKNTVKAFFFAGSITTAYGVLQVLNLDPLTWSYKTDWVAATLANPNFYSAFLGMFICIMLPFIFVNKSNSLRLLLVFGVIVSFYIILKTASQQGVILVLIAFAVTLFFYLKSRNLGRRWLITYLSLASMSFLILILDILQKVPWQPILYKTSVSARGDYWQAGIAVINKYPLTGVGFDGLREQYGLVRDPLSLTRGDQLDLDASHNIFIDKGVAGGIPLLLLYLAILTTVLFAIQRLAKNFTIFNPALVAVISCWIAWVAQSVISIDNVGVTSWGWYLSGVIIGLAALSKEAVTSNPELGSRFSLKNAGKIYIVGVVIGGLLAMPLVAREFRYVKSIERGDAQGLQAAALQFPQDVFRIGRAAELLKEYKIEKESIFLARAGVKNFPESYAAWAVLYTSPWVTQEERDEAKVKLFELDPLRAKYQGLIQ